MNISIPISLICIESTFLFVLFFSLGRHNRSNIILAALLLNFFLHYGNIYLFRILGVTDINLNAVFLLLYGPLVAFYAWSFSKSSPGKLYLYFIPGLTTLLILLFSGFERLELEWTFLIIAFNFFCGIRSLKIISTEDQNNTLPLSLTIGFLFLFTAKFVDLSIYYFYIPVTSGFATWSIFLVSLAIIHLIIFISIKHPGLLQRVQKYENSALELSHAQHIAGRIAAFFDHTKPYLIKAYSLSQLSVDLNLPEKHISQAINQVQGMNFSRLIQRYRVEDAKNLLVNKKDLSIKHVMLECGFGSKSTFNTVFQDFTGLTPSQFRERK